MFAKTKEHNPNQALMMQSFQCVVVGDGGVGKTCLLESHRNKMFTEDVSSKNKQYSTNAVVDSKLVVFNFRDTDDFDRIRPCDYTSGADAFLLCFSVERKNSLENIMTMWNPEVRKYRPKALIFLVGMKSDLRDVDYNFKCLNYSDGMAVASQIGACKYLECSARTQAGLNEMFEDIITTLMLSYIGDMENNKSEIRGCSLL